MLQASNTDSHKMFYGNTKRDLDLKLGTPYPCPWVPTACEHGCPKWHPCSRAVDAACKHGPWIWVVCTELNSATSSCRVVTSAYERNKSKSDGQIFMKFE